MASDVGDSLMVTIQDVSDFFGMMDQFCWFQAVNV